jgi:hypothetical protein
MVSREQVRHERQVRVGAERRPAHVQLLVVGHALHMLAEALIALARRSALSGDFRMNLEALPFHGEPMLAS